MIFEISNVRVISIDDRMSPQWMLIVSHCQTNSQTLSDTVNPHPVLPPYSRTHSTILCSNSLFRPPLLVLFLVFLFSTVLSALAPYHLVCFLLPVIHVDPLFHIVTRVLHSILWALRLARSDLFYIDEIFPLQVAETIWNDCHPVPSSPSHNTWRRSW